MQQSEPLNILLVDDSAANRVALSAALAELGERVLCVESGAVALRRLLDEEFAFVLLDVNMPGMDGFEVARLMRQVRRLHDTPIVLMSATYNGEGDQFAGYEAGAIDFITTPVSPIVLRAKVAALARHSRLSQALRRQADELQAANDRLQLEIDGRRQVEAELVASKELLEIRNAQVTEASRNKTAFVAHLAHELRTPLNAILGFAGTLLMHLPGPLNEEQERQLQTLRQSARHLLSMVTELLDLARIEAGKIDLHPEPVVCRQVLDDVVASLQPIAAAKGLALAATADPSLRVVVDRRALLQILLNLGDNAVKFTAQGIVALSASTNGTGASVEFTVADTGTGIARAEQARLFQPFDRLDDAGRRQQEGAGLGLHICQTLAGLIGGHLTVESEVGAGSTFRLKLPVQRA